MSHSSRYHVGYHATVYCVVRTQLNSRKGHHIFIRLENSRHYWNLYFLWTSNPRMHFYALKSRSSPFHFTAFNSHYLYKQKCQRCFWSVRLPTTTPESVALEEIPQVVCNEVLHLCIAISLNLALVGRRLFTAGCLTRFLVKWRKWTGVATTKQNK